MPTSLAPPPRSTPSVQPSKLLQSRHRWQCWRGILIPTSIGLAATLATLWAFHPSLHPPENWPPLLTIWGAGLLLTFLAAALGWRLTPSSLINTARDLDHQLATKNRLEAAAAWPNSNSPLAQAQREETAAYLQNRPKPERPSRVLPFYSTVIAALFVAHLATLALWALPLLHSRPASPQDLPKADITWKSPESETTANPIEEIPTVALAQSASGLKDLTLEISVNGALKKSIPLPSEPYNRPGTKIIKVSLYMDELEVQPFDIVSYFIRGQRIADQKVPDTSSDIQFIQINPFRTDWEQSPNGALNKYYELLISLKADQLRLLKENFILAHADLPINFPPRVQENDRIAQEQGGLSTRTNEAVQVFIEGKQSPDAVKLLRLAALPMAEAARKIEATQNNQALPSQEKSLNLLVEVEKFFPKVLVRRLDPSDVKASLDPFKKKQKHVFNDRMKEAAGHLELLAKNQTDLVDDLTHADTKAHAAPVANNQESDPFGPDADQGDPAERQSLILQGINLLLQLKKVFPPEVNPPLQDAGQQATESIRRLHQADQTGARDPAAKAAQDLQKAVAEMNKAGDQTAQSASSAALAQLSAAAQQLRELAQKGGSSHATQQLAGLGAQVTAVRKKLEATADQQQATGSATGALHLQQLADAISNMSVENDLAGMAQTGLDTDEALTDAQELEALVHAQREEAVILPDADEAPPAYRAAVSDYFETMSRNYHPDNGGQETKSP